MGTQSLMSAVSADTRSPQPDLETGASEVAEIRGGWPRICRSTGVDG